MDTKGMNMETVTAEKLNTLLDWVGETTKSAQGFMLEQAPLVAQEIVAWEFWSAIVRASVFMVVVVTFAIGCGLCVWMLNKVGNNNKDEGGWVGGMIFFGLVATVFFAAAVTPNLFWAVKAKVAPRLVIIEYVGKAVSK